MSQPSGASNFLGGLGAVKLRKTEVVHDASAPKLVGVIEAQQVDKWHNTVLDINMEEWLDLIPEETFHTEYFELTVDHAKTFVAAYECQHVHEPRAKELPQDIQHKISEIEAGLQKTIDSVRGKSTKFPDCVFVKTSCRSAKDTVVYAELFRQNFRENLVAKGDIHNDNNQLASLLEAAVNLLKVHTAKEVLHNFVNSERVYNDMKLALQHEDRFKQNFVVREWVAITPDMEFRGFVKNGKLNALSQYNHPVCWPRVVQHHERLTKMIREYFDSKVAPKIMGHFNEYVVDFAVTGDDLSKVWVIELNPFEFTTDGCLFSWQTERELLENGPFTFRYRDRESAGGKAGLSDDWARLISSELVNLKNKQ